ncbi:MAG: fibrillarin-like rRNA/tRNA 2'-O-methyltransferase [Methanobacteriota archaeon]
MQPTSIQGVFTEKERLYTENLTTAIGKKVYNERLITINGKEYRSWNPYRSKLAAALIKGLPPLTLHHNHKVLYLGAATGTTVSHISDIVKNGIIYTIENSPIAMKTLLQITPQRPNIIPLLIDANHPERYSTYVTPVDLIYQDISQRNQAEIFIKNTKRYLKKEGTGILIVKARSIDVSLQPKKAYALIAQQLQQNGLHTQTILDLAPYEKDHAIITISHEKK